MYTKQDLRDRQALPLQDKWNMSFAKIAEWYRHWDNKVTVSLSGGKDSSVLADICAQYCHMANAPLRLVYADTGLEYPEIRQNAKKVVDFLKDKYKVNVEFAVVRPKMRFDDVITKYGYPLISKEVSEAIYYARRIRSQNGHVEREREIGGGKTLRQKRRELMALGRQKDRGRCGRCSTDDMPG